jgi:FeoB-associated Cys-rich membrane protein
MNFDWQTVAVVLVIAVACVYLARSAWRTVARKKAGACGACPTCPSNPTQGEPQVIGVGQLTRAAPRAETPHNGAQRG